MTFALPILLVLVTSFVVWGFSASAVAQPPMTIAPVASEPLLVIDQREADKIRGGYVYSFTRFVTWRKKERSNFQVVVVGNARLAKLMASVAKRKDFTDRRTGKKYPIETHFYEHVGTLVDCDLIYIGTNVSSSDRVAILQKFSQSQTLVIADDTAHEQPFNSTARFVLRGGTVKFELNLGDARRRGLTIDAKLMTAASLILPDNGTVSPVDGHADKHNN